MVIARWPLGGRSVAAWRLLGGYLAVTWRLLGGYAGGTFSVVLLDGRGGHKIVIPF